MTTRHPDSRTPAARGAGSSSSPTRRTQAEIDSASEQLTLAAALCGLVAGDHLTCPWCGTAKAKKVKLVTDKRYVKCFACGEFRGAIKLVQETLGISFPAAVDLLNGKTPRGSSNESAEHRAKRLAELSARAEALAQNSFTAVLSNDTVGVYDAVLSSPHVSLAGAQRYYATWHISPEAVATVGFVAITAPAALARELHGRFGAPLLVASGLARALDPGDRDDLGLGLRFMFSARYPIVEPQLSPAGHCHSMQFRPSLEQKAKVDAHKRGEAPYAPAFMSLRGAGPEHLIGIGLDHLCADPPSRVDIVEGAKDVAADLTLGNRAFGMPGTGVLPPARSVQALAKAGHAIRVCLDGDSAGRGAQEKVREHFLAAGFPADRLTIHAMPDGMDVTDVLVARHANGGCACGTCVAWRARPPVAESPTEHTVTT